MSESALFNLQLVVAAVAIGLIGSFVHSFANDRRALERRVRASPATVSEKDEQGEEKDNKAMDTDRAAPMQTWPEDEPMFALVEIEQGAQFEMPEEIANVCRNKIDFSYGASRNGFQIHGPWHAMKALGQTPGVKKIMYERVNAPPILVPC